MHILSLHKMELIAIGSKIKTAMNKGFIRHFSVTIMLMIERAPACCCDYSEVPSLFVYYSILIKTVDWDCHVG